MMVLAAFVIFASWPERSTAAHRRQPDGQGGLGGTPQRLSPSLPKLNPSTGRIEHGYERRRRTGDDLELKSEALKRADDCCRIRVLSPQLDKPDSFRSSLRRVWTLAPVYQERYQPGPPPQVGVGKSPGEHPAPAQFALTPSHFAEVEPGAPSRGSLPLHVSALCRPRDEARYGESVQVKPTRVRRRSLGGIGADQLQVHGLSYADEGVSRALAGVAPADYRSNPGPDFQTFDLLIKTPSSPHEVIDGRQWSWLQRARRAATVHASTYRVMAGVSAND